MFQCQVRLKPNARSTILARVEVERGGQKNANKSGWGEQNVLICVGDLVLYGAFIVGTSAVGASAFLAVCLDVVVAELANLENTYHQKI